MTYAEWLEQWLTIYKLPTVGKKQQSNCRHAVNIIQRSPRSQKDVLDITEQDLQIILNTAVPQKKSEVKYSRSVLTKVRLVMRQSFRPLLRDGTVSSSPAAVLTLPLSPTKIILPLSHTEEDAVIAACHDDPLGHLIIFLLETGLRMSEMCNLTWDDYDPIDNSIFIAKSKTPAGIRKVYLRKVARKIIETQPHINKYIFNHTRQAPVTKTVMRRLVDRIRAVTNIKSLTCHVCRHTFVTRLCEKKTPAKAIAQIIGHANSDYVLDIYAMIEADELRKCIYILDDDGHSAVMGGNVTLPTVLYSCLQKEAEKQHVSVDALATFLLTSVVSKKEE